MENTKITPFEKDVSKWYSDLALKSNLVSYAPVKGTLFFSPYSFKIWDKIRKVFTNEFAKLGVEEVIFPSFFPMSYFKKEASHIEGFSPEVFRITHIGNKKLDDDLILRPTSEILFNEYFKNTLQSYNELPMKLNQWVSVFRGEKNTKPFLRNSEFLWQEGHTVHETEKEARDFTKKILDLYESFLKEYLLLPILKGEKTKNERFAGANNTYTVETILKDGQALQVGTSHYLGNNFTKVFNVKIKGKDNKYFFPYQTSWGVSSRLIGAILMTHSDNFGLILPSKIAPYQIVISSIPSKENEKNIIELVKELQEKLSADFNVLIDLSSKGRGFKIQKYETMGIPLRIEIGDKELSSGKLNILKRANNTEIIINFSELDYTKVKTLLSENDEVIKERAKKNSIEKIKEITSLSEIKKHIDAGYVVKCFWDNDDLKEKNIKEETGATIRLVQKDNVIKKSINSKEETNKVAFFARAY